MWSGRVVGAISVLVASLVVPPGPAHAAPGDPCPAAAPVEGTIDVDTVDTVDALAADDDRNHLTGQVGGTEVDYLSPPGEPLDESIESMRAESGLPADAQVTTELIERSVMVAMRRTNAVVGCVDDTAGGFVEVELTDPRLSYTGDPDTDPGGVQVVSGYLTVTIERLRTERPVLEFSVSGTAPQVPVEPSSPIAATPTFVG